MTGIVAGLGVKAIASSALKGAASGIGGFFKWLRSLDAKSVLLLMAVIFGAWQTFERWSQHRHTAKVETQLASATNALTRARTDLATSQANEAALEKAIGDQNAAIADLGSKSAADQKAAQDALGAATARADEAQATSARLSASSRSAAVKPPPACAPSAELKRQWKQ